METKVIKIYEELNMVYSESYKALRENIGFCSNNNIKTIAVTSSKPKEGKTTTAINFAISLANSGYSVLLIDADFRKSKINKVLTSSASEGISDYIEKNMGSMDSVICETSIDNLYFISSGKDTYKPSEISSSLKFKELLLNARERFDYVIIDTPAIGSVIDGSIIASIADGTVLVVQAGAVDKEIAYRTKNQLNNANANVLGVVLNKITKSDYKKYYRYYNYFLNNKGKTKVKRMKKKNLEVGTA